MKTSWPILTLLIFLTIFTSEKAAFAGTFWNPVDLGADIGATAANEFNQGLSHYYLILAALERSDLQSAASERDNAVARLSAAVALFGQMAQRVGQTTLNLDPRNDMERRRYTLLRGELQTVSTSTQPTYRDLANLAVRRTENFRNLLRGIPIRNLSGDRSEVHGVMRMSLGLQNLGLIASEVWAR